MNVVIVNVDSINYDLSFASIKALQ